MAAICPVRLLVICWKLASTLSACIVKQFSASLTVSSSCSSVQREPVHSHNLPCGPPGDLLEVQGACGEQCLLVKWCAPRRVRLLVNSCVISAICCKGKGGEGGAGGGGGGDRDEGIGASELREREGIPSQKEQPGLRTRGVHRLTTDRLTSGPVGLETLLFLP